jgi:hypothetical protein
MISTRSVGLVIDTVVCLTLDKWETVSGQFGGYLTAFLARISQAYRHKDEGRPALLLLRNHLRLSRIKWISNLDFVNCPQILPIA